MEIQYINNDTNANMAIAMLKTGFLEKMKNDVKKIILFGSYARNENTEDSDIDVAILTDCSRSDAKKYDSELMDVVTDIAMKTSEIVEYICIPNDEFEEKKNGMVFSRI